MRYAFVLLLLSTGTASRSEKNVASPVLVELFTSEGCSSCPPADKLLASLDRSQRIPGAEVIVLSEHVDYWDRLGWRDPFSSPQATQRQQRYADTLSSSSYTPQMVIDGKYEFVGSDAQKAQAAISKAAMATKTPIRLSTISRSDKEWKLRVEVDAAPASSELFLALADGGAVMQVERGENGGRKLEHVGVVRSIQSIGSLPKEAYSKEIVLKTSGSNQRAVAFIQAKNQGQVYGSALLK